TSPPPHPARQMTFNQHNLAPARRATGPPRSHRRGMSGDERGERRGAASCARRPPWVLLPPTQCAGRRRAEGTPPQAVRSTREEPDMPRPWPRREAAGYAARTSGMHHLQDAVADLLGQHELRVLRDALQHLVEREQAAALDADHAALAQA